LATQLAYEFISTVLGRCSFSVLLLVPLDYLKVALFRN